jgi:hypothetical protein
MGEILEGAEICSRCKAPADVDPGGGPYHAMVFCQKCGNTDFVGDCDD